MTTPTEEHSEMAREMAQSVSDLVAAAGYPLGMGVGYSERQIGMLTDKFASALESVERRAIERAALILDEWLSSTSSMLLACGEMSAQELRTVKAVLKNRRDAICWLATKGIHDNPEVSTPSPPGPVT